MSVPASEDRALPALADKAGAAHRRVTAQRVREARDRLTSTSGTRPAFDYELLRQFAQNRLSASLAVLLLISTIGFLSGIWTGPLVAGSWTVAVLLMHAFIIAKCRRFLAETPSSINIRAWRLR